jgi:hypothetical protein
MKDRKKGLAREIFPPDLTGMRRITPVVFILLVIIGCDDGDTGNCVIKEAVYRNQDVISGKAVFVHDGTGYTEARWYSYNQTAKEYAEDPYMTSTFTWDNTGRISTVKHTSMGYYQLSEFSYDDSNGDFTLIDQHLTESSGDNTFVDRIDKLHYVPSPKDGYYRFDDLLEEYKDGNLMRLGFASPVGTFEAYDTTWVFQVSYRYDNSPNTLGNYVFRKITYAPNFGHCRNNMVEETFTYPNLTFSKKQSFAFYGNRQLNRWEYEDTKLNVSFVYECR